MQNLGILYLNVMLSWPHWRTSLLAVRLQPEKLLKKFIWTCWSGVKLLTKSNVTHNFEFLQKRHIRFATLKETFSVTCNCSEAIWELICFSTINKNKNFCSTFAPDCSQVITGLAQYFSCLHKLLNTRPYSTNFSKFKDF